MDYLGHVTHYGHKNICRGVTDWRTKDGKIPIDSTRDFISIDQMNDAIVNNINNLVGQDDILIHGGDFSFGGFENIRKFRERIVCKTIYLIYGNHDHHIKNNIDNIRELFTSTNERLEVLYNKKLIIVDHYPLSSWQELIRGSIMLHGHCHFSNEKKISGGRRMDIGIDGNINFRPYNLFKECILPLLILPIGSDLSNDHHLSLK